MKPTPPPRVVDTDVVLDELFRHTPVGAVLCDLHCVIRDVNGAMCAMLGYDRAELIGHKLTEVAHPDDVADLLARTADLREGRIGSYVANRRYLTRGGELVYTRVSVSMVHSKEREPLCVIAFVENVTETVRMEAALRQSERHYRRLFDSLPVAVWENDWSQVAAELARRGLTSPEAMVAAVANDRALYRELGTTVRVTTVNPAALAMAGVETLNEFDAWLARSATPETAVRFSRIVPALIFGDRISAMDEYTLVRPNGEPIDVLIRIARSPEWGQQYTMSTIAVDVTDRRRIQRELEQKQELTERAEAAAHFGSWEWNPVDDVLFGSAEFWRILDGGDGGGPAQRPLDECLTRLVPEDRAAVNAWWNELRKPSAEARPREFTMEYRLARPDGSIGIVRSQRFVTYGEDGSIGRAFGILYDITSAKQAEEEAARYREELLRADKMITLGILVSGMAHEINNPNHVIGLNVPLVRDAWRDAAALLDETAAAREVRIGRVPWSEARGEVASMLDDIGLASERIRNIVTELRAYALDQEPGERHPVAVNDAVRSSMRLLGRHIARATKHFSLALAGDLPPVSANASRIEQVVVNLVLNACQALLSDEQTIRVETGVEDGRVFIRVRDEGRGMTPEQLATIRTPFFTTRRTAGGTGLGVPVADRIAREHGGELTFESQPGHGMTATLWLPVLRT